MKKAWWKSKTLRFNALVALFTAIELNLEVLKPFIGVTGYAALVLAIPVINSMLRTVTNEGLSK